MHKQSPFGPAISRGKCALWIEISYLQPFGPVISKIVFLKSHKYHFQKLEHTCCFFHYARFALKIVYSHHSFFMFKIPKLSSNFILYNQNIRQNLISFVHSQQFSFHNIVHLYSAVHICSASCTRVCLSQVTTLHHSFSLNLFYRFWLLMRDLFHLFFIVFALF